MNLSNLFISQAWAQTASAVADGGGASSTIMQFLPLVLIFGVFYVLIIRPQQKKLDQHGTMLKALRRGDKVVTGGGIIGTITKLEGDDIVFVEIADNIQVKVMRSTVTSLVAKTAPVVDGGANK
jgi:preprotein translocase subunit YajC